MDALTAILVLAPAGALAVLALLATQQLGGARTRGASRAGEGSTSPDPWQLLEAEVRRSRRTERPVTLVRVARVAAPGVVEPGVPPVQVDPPLAGTAPDITAALADDLRETDAAWVDGDELFILLAESEPHATDEIIGRLRQSGAISATDGVSWATFPTDALTADALVRAVRAGVPVADADSEPTPAPATAPAPTPIAAAARGRRRPARGKPA